MSENICENVKREDLKELPPCIVFRGCGGPVEEWYNGILEMWEEDDIVKRKDLKNYKIYKYVDVKDVIDLFFPLTPEMKLGTLAMWRLAHREEFMGMWLEDFLYELVRLENGSRQ